MVVGNELCCVKMRCVSHSKWTPKGIYLKGSQSLLTISSSIVNVIGGPVFLLNEKENLHFKNG